MSVPFINKYSAFLKTKLIYKRILWFYRKNFAEPMKIKLKTKKHKKENTLKNQDFTLNSVV